MAQELRRVAHGAGSFPAVVLVHPASPEQGDAHFASAWPEVAAIADPHLAIYAAVGRDEGRWWDIVGPPAWGAAARAVLGGYVGGVPKGSVKAMSGLYLVAGGGVVWSHVPESSGDHPDFSQLPAELDRALAGLAPRVGP